jgi:hypothetical protein
MRPSCQSPESSPESFQPLDPRRECKILKPSARLSTPADNQRRLPASLNASRSRIKIAVSSWKPREAGTATGLSGSRQLNGSTADAAGAIDLIA